MKSAHRNLIYAVSVVAIGFFWFGSVFFSYLEVLKTHFDAETVATIIISLSYGAQMLGILLYVIIAARYKRLAESKLLMTLSFGLSAVGILGSFISSNGTVIIISGALFSFFGTSGILLGVQFHCITGLLPQKLYGRTFGFAYAAGSLGTTLLAFAFNGRCPVGYPAAIIYTLFILLNFILMLHIKGKLAYAPAEPALQERTQIPALTAEKPSVRNLIFILVGVFLVMGILSSVSDLMQHAYIEASNQINSAYVRVFFAVGLILAGFLMDYNRRLGAIACLATHGFSFLLVLMLGSPGHGFEALALSYLLSGFHRVFQVTTSMDAASRAPRLFYVSVFGYLFSRMGEVLVSIPYNYVQFDLLRETLLASVFFVILLIMFFLLMKKLYEPVPSATEALAPKRSFDEMVADFGITEREAEALRLLLVDKNTSEIASAMHITEGTVYKYISSMIAKTSSKTRVDMIAKFSKHKP